LVLISILAPIFVIGVLVLVHELGHFLAAKRSGIRVETFSIGFGPAIVSFTRGDTVYKISWVPFGGYVKMSGEDPEDEEEDELEEKPPGTGDEPWRFHRKSVPIRAFVILAGPAANIILAIFTYMLIFWAYGVAYIGTTEVGVVLEESPTASAGLMEGDVITAVDGEPVSDWRTLLERIAEGADGLVTLDIRRGADTETIHLPYQKGSPIEFAPRMEARIGSIEDGGPADEAGLARGDRIVSVDGVPIEGWNDLREAVESRADELLTFAYEREGKRHEVAIAPMAFEEKLPDGTSRTVGRLQIGQLQERRRIGLGASIREGFGQTVWVTRNVFEFLKVLASFRVTRDMVGGPVSIFQLSGESAKRGFDTLLSLLAFLSVELGILNLLPIPVLDGGHMVFLIVEAIRRRPLSLKQRAVAQQIGLLLILLIMVTVTVFDVGKLLR